MSDEPIDKSAWGDGPWQDEPDELSWSFGDVPCRIVRHPHSGVLNGYVSVPASHPWHGQDFDEIEADCHGGLTFSGTFGNRSEFVDEDSRVLAARTYASRATTDRGLWWVGFDCAHAWDWTPGFDALYRERNIEPMPFAGERSSYKTIEYVKSEVENLARQAIAAMRSSTDLRRLGELDAEFAE